MPDCPLCATQLDDDAVANALWCDRCRRWWVIDDGVLRGPFSTAELP